MESYAAWRIYTQDTLELNRIEGVSVIFLALLIAARACERGDPHDDAQLSIPGLRQRVDM